MIKPQQFSTLPDTEMREEEEIAGSFSYEKVKTGAELDSYVSDIAETVRVGLDQSVNILTPWFFSNMPHVYYQTTARADKVRHLSAIITGHIFETKQTVELWDREHTRVTFIGPGTERSILLDMAHRLRSHAAKLGSLYFSRDRLLFLSTFQCNGYTPLETKNTHINEKLAGARKLIERDFPDDGVTIDKFLNNLDNDFVSQSTATRVYTGYRMLRYMLTHEGAHTVYEPMPQPNRARLTLGMKNVDPSIILESVLYLIHRYNFDIDRSFMVRFDKGFSEPIVVFHFIINSGDNSPIQFDSIPFKRLNKALRTLTWVDYDEYANLLKPPYDFSINAANLVRSMANWAHVFLSKTNPYYFSFFKIQNTLFKHQQVLEAIVDYFRNKFDPLREENRRNNLLQQSYEQAQKLAELIIDDVEKTILRECINFVENILKTNYFLSTKTGLAFRMNPKVLNPQYYPQTPFGIFFIVGRDYRCFHVRWKEIARGGLRVVMPRTDADYDAAIAGIFDEVYGLSYAQQLKNKDIPEGGSKAVLVLRPEGNRDQAVRGAVNALLDLLVSEDESREGVSAPLVSYYNKQEIIYLGPDENITNELIEWIPEQAARRGYRFAKAFMSSKPGEGINHKEFGVTSEGLNVFVTNMLKNLSIDPHSQKFSVIITGGPDGDVAGNELKILHRDFGENARVLAIADGFGAAHDPNGLAWKELLRLVHEGKPIADFQKNALSSSKDAFVIKADTPEHIKTRNELHTKFHADIFIPAGGRPYTVNDRNWQNFFDEEGKGKVKAIVEGANIFFTAGAREKIQEKGILIIKDSSANKCGVICSSYEVIASLVLKTEEFLAMKPVYVKEVLEILREKADNEAKLLFKEYKKSMGEKKLVQLSLEISKEINDLTDILLDELTQREQQILADPMFKDLVLKHCPPILREKFAERVMESLPDAHKLAILAAYIASFIVYREGLGWLEHIPREKRYSACISYIKQDHLVERLIKIVESSSMDEKDKIAAVLKYSAARDLTLMEMGEVN